MKPVLSKNFDVPDAYLLKNAKVHGAYSSLNKLFKMKPAKVIEEVKKSGLRGRGGAGFPTGVKWGFVPSTSDKPVYLVVNADESEPGTFKDRAILEKDPHLLIEGIIIAAYATQARTAFVYFRGEYFRQWERFFKALREAEVASLLKDLTIHPHRGAGAYICGEETALLNSIEGYRGLPRTKPPFPAVSGLFGCPTIVNNVETLASLPFIIREGAGAYAAMGTEKSKGTKLISVCGHVAKPGVYEVELGMPLAKFFAEYAGGTLNERALKAVIPGGSSVPVMTSLEAVGSCHSYESLEVAGTMLGSGGMIVMDEDTCMVRVLADIAKFYHHESCGQCSPCREGCGWIKKICDRIEAGKGRGEDLNRLLAIADGLQGRTICVFADALALPVRSFVTKFRKDFEEHIEKGLCPFAHRKEYGSSKNRS